MKTEYIACYVATKSENGTTTVLHGLARLLASSREEAIGMLFAFTSKNYPNHVVTISCIERDKLTLVEDISKACLRKD